jgi:uncharacterized protein
MKPKKRWQLTKAIKSQYNLGSMYETGQGVPADHKQAFEYYSISFAAQQGHKDAQKNIGFMYAKGRGVQKDLMKAATYFKIAADNGSKESVSPVRMDMAYERI